MTEPTSPPETSGPAVDLISMGDANLVSYLRHVAVTSDGGGINVSDGVLAFAGGHNYPGAFTNGVMRTGASAAASPEQVIATADELFNPLRRGYAVWVRTHLDSDLEAACVAAGLWCRPPEEGLPAIATAGRVAAVPVPPGTEIRPVEDDAGRRDFLSVVAAGWNVGDMPFELQERVLFSTTSLESPSVAMVLAYVDGIPLSGSMAYQGGGAAGMYWSATLPAARGRGLGLATMSAAAQAGFALGATCLTGQASAAGTPLWERLGFQVTTHYKRYLAKPGG